MTFELTPEQKRADIDARITAARTEIVPILRKYEVEIIAIINRTPSADVALPQWIDTRYLPKNPNPQAPAPVSTPEGPRQSPGQTQDKPAEPVPGPGEGTKSPIQTKDLGGKRGRGTKEK